MPTPPPNVVCLNDQCPEFQRGKANTIRADPAEIVCGGCGQPINIPTSVPPIRLTQETP